jgi:hypothetical protein
MLLFVVGALVGCALSILVYHFQVLKALKGYAVDWRARAISAEQEVENWKNMWKSKGFPDPFH